MLATVDPWLIFWVLVAGLVIGFIFTVATIPLAARVGRALAAREQVEDQAARDHGEPTRRQIESPYGPLAMWGTVDRSTTAVEADRYWNDWPAYWAQQDAVDDAREDRLDRELRDGLMDWGKPA